MDNNYNTIIIGAGPAGMEAAYRLSVFGIRTCLLEKEAETGGHLLKWDRIFPEGRKASEILGFMRKRIESGNITTITSARIDSIRKKAGNGYEAELATNEGKKTITADTILIACGFKLFNAAKKEEYGYGIYNRVITNADLENLFKTNSTGSIIGENRTPAVGFVHCVGSRDEKAGNRHCSKVCCATAVKQAMEIKEAYPQATVYCFYMDLRMFGRHYEDMYLEAQQKYGIRFIRGRVSEVSEDCNERIVAKAEDTLSGKPVKITLDMLVLMSGIACNPDSGKITGSLSIENDSDGFIKYADSIFGQVNGPGIFTAGTCTGPKTLPETINEAGEAAAVIYGYLKGNSNNF